MANSILNIPELNPVKFYSETLKYPKKYQTRFMDDFSFANQIKSYQTPVNYEQKWCKEDIIHVLIETDYTDIKFELVGEYDRVFKSVIPQTVLSAVDPDPLSFQIASITLDDVAPGDYYLRIKVTIETGSKNYVSESICVNDEVENSILFQYSNTTNDFGVPFDTGVVFQFRVEGGLTDFTPEHRSKVYDDQNLNPVRLSANPYHSYRLVIGSAEGVPDWVADKINRVFSCDFVTIDGDQYVRGESGKMEPKREENYPMAGWSIDVRPAQSDYSKLFRTYVVFGVIDYDGSMLTDFDNKPLLYK